MCTSPRHLGEYLLAVVRGAPTPVSAHNLHDLQRLFDAHVPVQAVYRAMRRNPGMPFRDIADRLIDAQLGGRTA